ncbi:MAG: diacylglycerol kinase family protein [Candidatus Saganbacteria bacterium]|nr:diacylglycerol kinase family protein [Candidatus Saganbacteria bacterium]
MPKRLMRSFKFARLGAVHAWRTERNLWLHFLIALLVLVVAVALRVGVLELALLVLTIGLVITAEMFNTALEELVNLVEPANNPLAALAKNVAAGAVLIAAVTAGLVGVLVIGVRLIR